MGAEAGQALSEIIRRKEIERRGCEGLFLWGIGNSLGSNLALLRRCAVESCVVFSPMRSKPRVADSSPATLRLWLSYIDGSGRERELPTASLVTSRARTTGGHAKDAHYALICESRSAIDQGPCGEFDASTLVNLASGRPVGASQVTSVVRLGVARDAPALRYSIGFMAKLQGPGQVRLARSAEINPEELVDAVNAAEGSDVGAWKAAVSKLKRAAVPRAKEPLWLHSRSEQIELFAA